MKLQYRIKDSEEFKIVIEKRQVLKFRTITVYYSKNSLEHSRFGLSVGKKIGNAVTRNLIKRRLRATIKDLSFEDLCVDFIIIAKPSICDASIIDIENEMNLMNIKIREKINEQKD